MCLYLDAGTMAARCVGPGINGVFLPGSPARHEDDAWAVPRTDEAVRCPRRAVHEVPRLQPTLLTLDHQNALTGEHEEMLLVGLGVVQPARLSRAEYLEREADVGEPVNGQVRAPAQDGRVGLEDASGSECGVGEPSGIPDVEDEPAVGQRRQARAYVFERCFLTTALSLTREERDVPDEDRCDGGGEHEEAERQERGAADRAALRHLIRRLLRPVDHALERPLGPGELQCQHREAQNDRGQTGAWGEEHDHARQQNEKPGNGKGHAEETIALPVALLPRANALDQRRPAARFILAHGRQSTRVPTVCP